MNCNVTLVQQVRQMSGKRIAYPFYPAKRLTRQHPKVHDTNLKYAMRQFLGPRNYKGEYVLNKYFRVPNDHTPNYIKPDLEKGQTLKNPATGQLLVERHDGSYEPARSNKRLENIPPKRLLQPFPENPHCVTNYIISDELKQKIYKEITNQGSSTQQVAQKYGLKIPRIEAIVKLNEIERSWESENKINKDLRNMSTTLYNMFPLFEPSIDAKRENLSEIPVPPSALKSRFLTIAESQPFGPIDAAKVLELEPASDTLEKLSTIGEHSSGHQTIRKINKKVIYGEMLQGEKSLFKFTEARVGKVGFRYGRVNRDNKKDRKIGFNEAGKMVYI
ncbi:hypothetical protein Kpol_1060p47 [Vanderwaltozyma polyspora DSM 70294]|uniref:37S ribosomal protein S35, mitochondrial n=1 Tax=Vanderwaltozyma polyspora (strain ATCC 22028 / DSM 70294 / BCRC 21397 / CBS 2163 / NBRC 10782 / NRRL Y-8283 / UCD 57-17) TaxID=436907 RepID=A7TK45_VANPO|nr:uncharacterized protein Kpol_1060p47 [Vanderwaltozyma polyspora DSM 70294]EDO17391.1 hypothetical protein Kpol_1060p47 [Vanderwaltozyma polyspora DSM 70294]